ncbi:MAG: PRC-barrel domain-containing protein [Gammaproteobacteria bacterium]|nr:PRC-barrel domain-containing protein [Gammaproteobacteria bacterium]
MSVKNFMTASQIIGQNVINSHGEDIGKIKDLVVNIRSDEIAYAVLSFGGFLGMGDKLFAIPFQLMKINPKKDFVVLDMKKSVLEKAPGFDKQNWPDFNNSKWIDTIETYYVASFEAFREEELI